MLRSAAGFYKFYAVTRVCQIRYLLVCVSLAGAGVSCIGFSCACSGGHILGRSLEGLVGDS